MSDSHQDAEPAHSERGDLSDTQPVSQNEQAKDSTPVKKKHGPNQAFATKISDFKETRKALNKEMVGHWLGLMPVERFFYNFLPRANSPLPALPQNPFGQVPNTGAERDRYINFIEAIQEWIPHLHAVNTSSKEDTETNLGLKTDIAIYNRIDGVAAPTRTDFSQMELWMEFKTGQGVAFRDPTGNTSFTPDTAEGRDARGQLCHYAGAHHMLQFRHFSFSILVEGNIARFIRWERGAAIVTEGFDYRAQPELMAEFLWRFNHMSAVERGHDESVQLSDLSAESDSRVRELLGTEVANALLFRYTIPGLDGRGYAYGPRPPTTNRSISSRCTRTLPVAWIPYGEQETQSEEEGPWCKERVIYMKDTWRYVSESSGAVVMPEHEIYELLHGHGTPNILEHVAGGDVEGGRTRAQEFMNADWVRVKPEKISPYQHYRLVLGVVGRPLIKFDSTKQLVTALLDAVKAHSHAYEVAKILHRDISAGNIILTDDGRGLLIDWELAKKVSEVKRSGRPDRTGTWQFMSANLLKNPLKVHTFADDLESFLHVLGWTTLRYVPAQDTFNEVERATGLEKFDEFRVFKGYSETGGHAKSEALRGSSYPSETFRPRQETPLYDLLGKLSTPFASLYATKPPTVKDRDNIGNLSTRVDDLQLDELLTLAKVKGYDANLERLKSSAFFINEMEVALNRQDWPMDDKADPNLPIASLKHLTELKEQREVEQRQHAQNSWVDSKGTGGLKRSASEMAAEGSGTSLKRQRSTPMGSASSAS